MGVNKMGRKKGAKNIVPTINELCKKCKKECKQFAFMTIINCHYVPNEAKEKINLT
jgi:hypothetical protein